MVVGARVRCGGASWGLSLLRAGVVPGNPLAAGRRANGELSWARAADPRFLGAGPKGTGPGHLQSRIVFSTCGRLTDYMLVSAFVSVGLF